MRPKRIKRILNATLRKLGLEKRIKECAILSFWNEAVGESIASHTRPLKVYDGRMTVLVESPSWTQELTFLKNRIIERLNRSIGKEVVRDIYFKIGNVRRPLPEEKPASSTSTVDLERIKLDKGKREKIEESLRKIEDPEIKKILRDFLTKEARYETVRDEKRGG